MAEHQYEHLLPPSWKPQVTAWLAEHNVTATPLTPAGDWVSFSVPVSKANEMFDADYAVYTHAESGKITIRTLSYSVPSDLTNHLKVVYPSTTYVSRS